MEDLDKIKEFFSKPLPEKQGDAIDTISMDVPLFIRMLEYAKEDAKTDMDLHDATERALKLSKTKPSLSMGDYNQIVAGAQGIDEEVGFMSLRDDNPFDDIPSIDIQIIDDKEGTSSPKAFVNFSSMYHSGDNGKMEILKDNPALQDKVMKALQSEFQKTFRRVIHSTLGEPFGLDEEEGYSPQLVSPENPQGKTPGLTPDVMSRILKKIIQDLDESKRPGLWANIHAKRERGEKPARKGSKAWKAAKKAGDAISGED